MKRNFALFVGIYVYMELVYHLASFGAQPFNPVLALPVILMMAAIQTALVGFCRKKGNLIILWCLLSVNFLIYAVQLVYLSIFKQPLLTAAMVNAGQDALTNYWRETLNAIWSNTGYLILLALPLVGVGLLLRFKILVMKSHRGKERLAVLGVFLGGVLTTVLLLVTGFHAKWEWYEEYQEFYDPSMVIERFGVLASVQRDALKDALPPMDSALDAWSEQSDPVEESQIPGSTPSSEEVPSSQVPSSSEEVPSSEVPPEDIIDTSPNVMPIDFEKLMELAETKDLQKLVNFMKGMEPTNKNEYTGMFEGYNLIYLTAEGLSTAAIHPELTPTLYKLTHSGFVVEDYYVPLWQTSTSDGEYVNLTGLIPDQQFSMRRSAVNEQPFSLAAYFAAEGAKSYGYHNNTLEYYDRHVSHPNMGYDFKASKTKTLPLEEWGDMIFPMENADSWPASDLDMMKATIPEYIDDDRFHVYYMTVSGHMNYNFTGNRMARKHKEEVAELPYSEEGKAYIACNMELDRALEYLIEELDKAGKLENTVIALSADHYPYDMDMKNYEELVGMPLDGTLDLYRNSLILWNSEMETVEIEKTCSAEDLLPTLLNLFGFEYDSRLYAGKDMLSDSPSLVIFSNRSFITDTMEYDRKTKTITSLTDEPVDEAYYEEISQQVKGIYEYSAGILNHNFYKYVKQALVE
ncbi:MAG: LTA synthase family protein [Lachnospiraceae bacterium]|nr:LTA synthase family protein [Lachnospiraceae bacterium]